MNCSFITDRNIGESCVRDQQCVSFNSTCNKTSGMCQCKTGHVYHRKTDTCEPGKVMQFFFTELFMESEDGYLT